jgi:hypothetical protein
MNLAIFRNEYAIRGLFWVLLIGFLLLNLAHKAVLSGSYAPDLGGFERNVIWGIQQIMDGQPLYRNPDSAPFSLIQYMPLYYYLMAFLGKIFGVPSGDAHAVYSLCRSFNLLISILICGGIFVLLRKPFRISLFTAFGFSVFAFLILDSFTISGRPDMLKTFFFILQVLLLASGAIARLRYKIPVSLLLSLLCFLCKQDGITAFGILPLAFLAGREWKNFMIYCVAACALLAATLFTLQLIFAGNFFSNAIGALQNGISISWFMSVFSGFFVRYAILFAPAIILALEFFEEKNRRFRILASAFVLSFFPPVLAALKYGSGPNYFQEAFLISCILLAIGAKAASIKGIFRYRENALMLVLLVYVLFTGMAALNWVTGVFLNQEANLQRVYQKDFEFSKNLRNRFASANCMLLTDRQWEDNLSTLLADRIINPNRDVSAQVFTGKKGNALHGLKSFVKQSPNLILITRKGQNPAFDGLDFSAYKPGMVLGAYQLWQQ